MEVVPIGYSNVPTTEAVCALSTPSMISQVHRLHGKVVLASECCRSCNAKNS